MNTTLAGIVVSTAELGPSRACYADLVGLTPERRQDGFAWLRTSDGAELMLHERPATPSLSAVAVGLFVADVDKTVAAWQEQGGTVIDPPADQPWGERMAVVTDPDAHVVCLSQQR